METVTIVSPTGNIEVWPESEAQAKVAEGYKTFATWRTEQEAALLQKYQEWLTSPATENERFQRLRASRDAKLTATDYLMTPDYPLPDEQRQAVVTYRTALRDLPAQEGAPWDGGGSQTPWPEAPAIIKD